MSLKYEPAGIMPRSVEYLFKTIKKRPQQKFAVPPLFLISEEPL